MSSTLPYHNATKPFPLLHLPQELREHIFAFYFNPFDRLAVDAESGPGGGRVYIFDFRLLRVNKQICEEARGVWKRVGGSFVKIDTPWAQAVQHVSSEGLVPIVAFGERARLFKGHTFHVAITSPLYHAQAEHSLVLLLEDIPLFTQTWYYSALNYPVLNTELQVEFKARPAGGWSKAEQAEEGEGKGVALDLQRKMLQPFEKVKDLHGTDFSGFDNVVTAEVLRNMAVPHPTLQECIEASVALVEEGDRVLAEKNPAEALELYGRAFHAIHIGIEGRTRRMLAEGFFDETIIAGRFAGQSGTMIRIVLRIRLVSRYILAYLRLNQPDEAAFWGMRSIRIMREALSSDFEDGLSDFVGMSDVGPLCSRTAIAFQVLENNAMGEHANPKWKEELRSYEGDFAGSRVLWGLAGKYLKGLGTGREEERKAVLKEAEEFGVVVPEGVFLDVKRAVSEVDSLGYLDLAGVELDGDDT